MESVCALRLNFHERVCYVFSDEMGGVSDVGRISISAWSNLACGKAFAILSRMTSL